MPGPTPPTNHSVASPERRLNARLGFRPNTSTRVTKLSQHEADGGKFHEREGVAIEIFPILAEAAATIEPCNLAFDDPAVPGVELSI